MRGVEKVHAEHFNGNENRFFEVICGVHSRECRFQAFAPGSELVLIIDISAQLQEPPENIRQYVFLG